MWKWFQRWRERHATREAEEFFAELDRRVGPEMERRRESFYERIGELNDYYAQLPSDSPLAETHTSTKEQRDSAFKAWQQERRRRMH